MQNDLKRLVAYSSIAHLGFIVLGTFAFTSQAISGSVMQMINHGISTGALFLLVGMIYERRHTREIAKLRGIQQVAPMFAAGFMVVMLSSIGVPGLNGFVGEYLILIGSFLTARWWVVVAATGVILAALYLLWAYQRVFHGEPDDDNKQFAELTLKEASVLVPLIGVIVFTGIYPKPMLDRIEPAVNCVDRPRRGAHRLRGAAADAGRTRADRADEPSTKRAPTDARPGVHRAQHRLVRAHAAARPARRRAGAARRSAR